MLLKILIGNLLSIQLNFMEDQIEEAQKVELNQMLRLQGHKSRSITPLATGVLAP